MSHKAKSVNLNDFNNSINININNIINQQDNIKFLKENLKENEIDDSKLIEDINNFLVSTVYIEKHLYKSKSKLY